MWPASKELTNDTIVWEFCKSILDELGEDHKPHPRWNSFTATFFSDSVNGAAANQLFLERQFEKKQYYKKWDDEGIGNCPKNDASVSETNPAKHMFITDFGPLLQVKRHTVQYECVAHSTRPKPRSLDDRSGMRVSTRRYLGLEDKATKSPPVQENTCFYCGRNTCARDPLNLNFLLRRH